jgi:ribonuclease MRP protein subunit RMP1
MMRAGGEVKKMASAGEQQRTELIQIGNVLALAWHRNKNQHRRSRWWKELGILRRNLRRLVDDGQARPLGPVGGIGNKGKKFKGGLKVMKGKVGIGVGMFGKDKEEDERKEKEREKRVAFLKEQILPRCLVAFSAVVADNQYAVLGLMLLGTLGRLGKVLGGVDLPVEDVGEKEHGGIEIAVEGEGGEWTGAGQEDDMGAGEDLGVPLQRGDVLQSEGEEGHKSEKKRSRVEGEEEDATVETPTPAAKKKKKKKKHGDAIDDIFAGLT